MNHSRNKKHDYEFGGPMGALLLMIGLPLAAYYLYYCVRFNGGNIYPMDTSRFHEFAAAIVPTGTAAAMVGAWIIFHALLQRFLPGATHEGARLADGTRLPYRMNGRLSFIVTIAAVFLLFFTGILRWDAIHENFGALISVTVVFVWGLSLFLYFYGKRTGNPGERTGSGLYDFFMGTARNPRPGGFDLKFFCEARPGLMGWILINVSFMGLQYERIGHVTAPMVLVNAFQLLYVADYFWNEPAILTTTDIVNENFGFMLAFGDLVWVPFTYSLQAFYLLEHTHGLPPWGSALIILLNAGGYYIFRAVNLQKHRFRTDPSAKIWGREPAFIQTAQGNRLLVSGFWGLARHFNYVGDIMMAAAWCLPCLFDSPLPYFYVIYFTALLVHRERRDDKNCARKYGKDWEEYRKRVPWRIIPKVY